MKAIFQRETYQQQLDQDGFVVIPSFLDEEQLPTIRDWYQSLALDNEDGFYSTSFLTDTDKKRAIAEKVEQLIGERVKADFKEIKPLGSVFLVKKPGEEGRMPVHQDWTVVDEPTYGSYTIWIPLVDTTGENGAIQAIPGSHKFSDALRSPSIPPVFSDIYPELHKHVKTLPMKAGDAFVFNHALMHSSEPNRSVAERPVLTYGLVPQEAQLRMYYLAGDGKLSRYSMPDDMFIRYPEIREKPLIGELVETIEHEQKPMSVEQLNEQLYAYRKEHFKMEALFTNNEHQAFFEENGYLKVPALQAEDIQQLLSFYKEANMTDANGYGFNVGMDHTDKEFVSRMMEKILSVAMPRLQHLFGEVQQFTASFVVKFPNPKGVVPPHQDWSFVEDETKHCSVTCWIPLVDVNQANGCLGVVKGSNKFFDSPRPSPSPQVETPLKKHMFTIFPYVQLVEMKAGEAMFFDNRTIHASPPNITDKARIAIGIGFTQKEAQIRHYYLKPGTHDTLLKYKIDPDFFKKYDNAGLSKMYDEGKLIEDYELQEEMPYVWEDLTPEQFRKRMSDAGNTFNQLLIEHLADLFNYNLDGTPKGEHKQEEPEVVETNGHSNGNDWDNRSFWQTYTPLNIIREIRNRITGKA